MDRYNEVMSNLFTCVQIIVLCSVISVNGFNSYSRPSHSPKHSVYRFSSLLNEHSPNIYVNEMYKLIDANPEDVKEYDLIKEDEVLRYLEYGYKDKCRGYKVVQGAIGYTFINPKLTHKDFVVSGFYCCAPDNPVDDNEKIIKYMSDDFSFHVLNSGPKYLEDLKSYSDMKCSYGAALDVFYVSPSVSRSRNGEVYFTNTHCI